MDVQFLLLLVMVGLLVAVVAVAIARVLTSLQQDQLELERLKARVGMKNSYQQQMVTQNRCQWCTWGQILGPKDPKEIDKTQQLLIRAGYRQDNAVGGYFFIKTLAIILGVILGLVLWAWKILPVPFAIAVPIIFMLLPERILIYLGNRRLDKINYALPDFLDMANICMNAGLSYMVAVKRVTEELKDTFPEICYEFDYMLDQVQLGVPRIEALKQLAERNPTEDIQQLVQVLIQNEKLGTPIGQALNDFTRRMYQEREQRMEEKAAKTSAKMAIVTVPFLMLPYFILMLGEKMVMLGRNW